MIGMPTPRAGKNDESSSRVRIQRVLADAGVASRRACESLVEEGAVTVNGRVIQKLPCFVDPESDRIFCNGRRIEKPRRHHYIMLFKPRGFVCTSNDPEGRKRALDLVDHPSGVRLFSVGRLDIDSSGLLLLTDDGDLANRLTHPSFEVHKGYDVTVRGRLEEEAVEKLRRGLYLSDRRREGEATRTAESGVTVLRRDRDRTRLYVELREGRNRQIRRLMDRIGHPVKKLRRVRLGPLKLKGLAVGDWRELTPAELGLLRRASQRVERREKAVARASKRKAKKAATKKTTGKKSTTEKTMSSRTSGTGDKSATRKTSGRKSTTLGADRRRTTRSGDARSGTTRSGTSRSGGSRSGGSRSSGSRTGGTRATSSRKPSAGKGAARKTSPKTGSARGTGRKSGSGGRGSASARGRGGR
jgi:pseudouridine synthase